MGVFKKLFGKKEDKKEIQSSAGNKNNPPSIPDTNSTKKHGIEQLLRDIRMHCSIVIGDDSNDKRINQLIDYGQVAIPLIENVILSIAANGESDSEYRNGGLLCEAIGKIGGSEALNVLTKLCFNNSNVFEYNYIRAGAIRGLVFTNTDKSTIEDLLKKMSAYEKWPIVSAAIEDARYSLQSTISNDVPTVEQKHSFTWQPGSKEAEAAQMIKKGDWKKLAEVGIPAVEPLIAALESREELDKLYQYHIIVTLGKIGDPRAVNPLINTLSLNNPTYRAMAADSLGKLGDKKAVEPLMELLKDSNSDVRIEATNALGNLGDNRAVNSVIQMLNSNSDTAKRVAAIALGNIGDRQAVAPLIASLKKPWQGESMYDYLITSLVKIGDPSAIEGIEAAMGNFSDNKDLTDKAIKAINDLKNKDSTN